MSESGDSGPGRREVAHRLFAAEFDDAEFSYSESDEERAPNYVVTPTGARVNRLFVVGVLTELEQVNEEVLRARIVDPTGPFVVYAGQYQPEALAFLEAATPPLFVAVTGKARTFEPEDSDRVFTSVRPESISEVDAETRDRWVVQAAEQTLARVGRLAGAKRSDLSGDALQQALIAAGVDESDAAGGTLALEYYDTTGDYLQAVRDLARNAARVVAGERDEAGSLSLSPGDGTDEPLATLATVDLEAPAEAPAADETEPAGASTADSASAGAGSDETELADTSTDESEPAGAGSDDGASTVADESATDDAVAADSASSAAESSAGSDPTETAGATEPEQAPSDEPTSETGETAPADEPTEAPTDTETASPEPESVSTEPSTGEGGSGTLGDFDGSADADDEVGDFDTEFELDEDEREEIEAEYGTDFQSGTEVDDAGEAGIETPDPEELAEAEATDHDEPTGAETETESAAPGDSGAAATAAGADTGTEPPAEDVDLEDAVMDVMSDLNDGSGADREAVITEVVETYGADRDGVEDAIQDALMGGRCYEPDDGKLTPI